MIEKIEPREVDRSEVVRRVVSLAVSAALKAD